MLRIVLPEEYPYVMGIAAVIAFECLLVGFLVAGGKRQSAFNADFMKQFDEQHAAAFPGTKAPKGGYPDHGTGIYSQKLSYADWYTFNLRQRAHKNFIEQLTVVCIFTLLAGLFTPQYAIILGSIYAVGRLIGTLGYIKSAQMRVPGMILTNLSLFALEILAGYNAYTLVKSVNA
mmetsp:Transcript_90069/g.124333  ORF Transcript_90069/g.124333 Transcript_90069/m.124333 type:complete len:175 (+) Transcript_90069:27-551(+)